MQVAADVQCGSVRQMPAHSKNQRVQVAADAQYVRECPLTGHTNEDPACAGCCSCAVLATAFKIQRVQVAAAAESQRATLTKLQCVQVAAAGEMSVKMNSLRYSVCRLPQLSSGEMFVNWLHILRFSVCRLPHLPSGSVAKCF